ncbi:MAG: hypothetical protein GNW80_13600 [Asgard group archaeon]|nr:hypothetical protein [Asgard group archaeon]
MNKEEYRKVLLSRELDEKEINQTLFLIDEFEVFLKKVEKNVRNATKAELDKYILYKQKSNSLSYEGLFAITRYILFISNEELLPDLIVLIDGAQVMHVLSDKITKELGEEKKDEIFTEINLPPVGIPHHEKPLITKTIMDRMENCIDKTTREKIMISGLHQLPKDTLVNLRKKILKEINLDNFLESQRVDFLRRLEQHKIEGTLFYSQPIDEKVLNYIRENPETEYGVRKGNKIIISKIPFQAKLYLNEEDEKLKRYYYCHCPWVREALKKGDIEIPHSFCYCSAGWYKQKWDAIFDQSVKVDLMETVLKGDSRCTFAIHIPEEFSV